VSEVVFCKNQNSTSFITKEEKMSEEKKVTPFCPVCGHDVGNIDLEGNCVYCGYPIFEETSSESEDLEEE